jgi:DNA-binding response OmpR family regulator
VTSSRGEPPKTNRDDGEGTARESTRRVLVVDDDEDTREIFAEALASTGHVVTTASDGEEALAVILRGGLDVALLDVTLPRIDGAEVARRARERLGVSAPYFVALSGHSPDSPAVLPVPFDVYFVKPVGMAALFEAVAAAPRRAAGTGR